MEAGGKDAARAAEEEVFKRSTDCVYFLASPLTCKKGVECEYRHSEGARVNPRDCWFWLNGNCLNPKCSFRHPPLDGLIGTPTATGSALPSQPKISTQASSMHSPATQNAHKQSVPCYYFQKGGCLKGDKCPFSHGSAPMPNPVSQQAPKVATAVTEPPQTIKKMSRSLDRGSQQNILKETSDLPIEVVHSVKLLARADTLVANGMPSKEIIQSNVEFPSRFETNVSLGGGSAPGRSQSRQSEPLDDEFQNDREGDEYFRESSPGFDVLVDDETEDPGYFCDEDEFRGASSHDGRSMNPAADFDYHHSSDYETAAKFRREPHNDASEYGHHAHANDYYELEHHGSLSERALERPSVTDRRRLRREDGVTMIDGSDLRHQLLKKRRVNSSRSGVSPDRREPHRNDEHYFEEQRYRGNGRRNDPRNAPREISTAKRLQGRISLPRRIPADSNGDIHSDREIDRGRSWSRSSPGRSTNYHPWRLHDRINRRSSENPRSDEKNFGAPSVRRDEVGTVGFTGPKRLSELKSKKFSHTSEQRSIDSNIDNLSGEHRNMKLGKALGHQDTESVPFEGPQPLSVILKRKREAAAANSTSVIEEGEDKFGGLAVASVTSISSQVHRSSESMGKDDQAMDPEVAAVDVEEEDPIIGDVDQPSAKEDANEIEDDALEYIEEDVELEDYEQRDGEYYQEDNEDGEYEAEGGDMYEEVEEDEEGDDDFAKKLAMYN